jgi:rhamnogalacturonyl hydrolase YesR
LILDEGIIFFNAKKINKIMNMHTLVNITEITNPSAYSNTNKHAAKTNTSKYSNGNLNQISITLFVK